MNEHRHPKGVPAGGQFAPGSHTEPDVGLTRTTSHAPVIATVQLQEWQGDYAINTGTVSFDAAPLLAAMSAEERTAVEDHRDSADELFYTAVRQGLVPGHDGPFELEVRDAMDEAVTADPDVFIKASGAPVSRHQDAVLDIPLTPYEMGARADEHDRVSGLSTIAMGDLIDNDLEDHLDYISEQLTGSSLLMDSSATPVTVDSDGNLIVRIEGDASGIIDGFDDAEMADYLAGRKTTTIEGQE